MKKQFKVKKPFELEGNLLEVGTVIEIDNDDTIKSLKGKIEEVDVKTANESETEKEAGKNEDNSTQSAENPKNDTKSVKKTDEDTKPVETKEKSWAGNHTV